MHDRFSSVIVVSSQRLGESERGRGVLRVSRLECSNGGELSIEVEFIRGGRVSLVSGSSKFVFLVFL